MVSKAHSNIKSFLSEILKQPIPLSNLKLPKVKIKVMQLSLQLGIYSISLRHGIAMMPLLDGYNMNISLVIRVT